MKKNLLSQDRKKEIVDFCLELTHFWLENPENNLKDIIIKFSTEHEKIQKNKSGVEETS